MVRFETPHSSAFMFKLYATPGSGNCFKPFLAMRQLSLPFQVQMVDVLGGETRSETYRAINPAGTVPFLCLSGGYGLGESNAMLWFIADGSSLVPENAYDRAQVLQWLFFEQSRLEPFISPARFFTTIVPDRGATRKSDIAAWQERGKGGLELLNEHLRERDFVAGSAYSIADIGVFGYVHVSDEAGLPLLSYPAVHRWIERVQTMPGFVPLSELLSTQDRELAAVV